MGPEGHLGQSQGELCPPLRACRGHGMDGSWVHLPGIHFAAPRCAVQMLAIHKGHSRGCHLTVPAPILTVVYLHRYAKVHLEMEGNV